MRSKKHKPTPEQDAIRSEYLGGEHLITEAFAGTGKTSTLVILGEATPDETIKFLAYNKSVALDAQAKFSRNVECRTAHSYAYRAIGVKYQDRLNGNRMTAKQQAAILGIKERFTINDDYGLYLKPKTLAWLTRETVKRFCYSGDYKIGKHHVKIPNGAEAVADDLRSFLLPYAIRYWEDLQLPTAGKLPFQHDDYLKMWQLSEPELKADAIFYDEAQDANPCNTAVVLGQKNAQLIAVGDRNQAIYGWRGAEDAMQTWPADKRMYLTKSFRFGQAVADEANKWLKLLGAEKQMQGFEQVDSKVGYMPLEEANAILCRTNAGVMGHCIEGIEAGKKVAIVGGTYEIRRFAEAAGELKAGNGTDHPDLAAFQDWGQVKEYVNEGGSDLKVFVKLIDDYGVEQVLSLSRQVVDEKDAEIILSTAHKAKGREWDNVKIGNDFKAPEGDDAADEQQFNRAEAMLAYVAITRAKLHLDCEDLQWVNNFLDQPRKEVVPLDDPELINGEAVEPDPWVHFDIAKQLEERRNDKEFMTRLAAFMEENK